MTFLCKKLILCLFSTKLCLICRVFEVQFSSHLYFSTELKCVCDRLEIAALIPVHINKEIKIIQKKVHASTLAYADECCIREDMFSRISLDICNSQSKRRT